MKDFYELSNRDKVPVYVKMKNKPEEAKHLIKYKAEKDYEYYKCDYCGSEIKILKKKSYEMTGGIVSLPHSLTKRGEIKLALCNKCLNPVIKEFEKEEKK